MLPRILSVVRHMLSVANPNNSFIINIERDKSSYCTYKLQQRLFSLGKLGFYLYVMELED